MIGERKFRLVTSPMLRARMTAEQVRLRHPGVAVEVDEDIVQRGRPLAAGLVQHVAIEHMARHQGRERREGDVEPPCADGRAITEPSQEERAI